jgi:imidazolonepropionase
MQAAQGSIAVNERDPPRLLRRARLLTLDGPPAAAGRPGTLEPLDHAALVLQGGRIAWLGAESELPSDLRAACGAHPDGALDLDGALVTPGLIDCHTHLVWAGERAAEFELRLAGASYEAIARAGGGIRSTVAATRAASEDALAAQAAARAAALEREGVTTVEIKSGYGLELAAERRCLRVARRLQATRALEVRTTFLGAHAVPPEYDGRPDAYIDEAVLPMLDTLAAEGLVDAVDAFCERIGFTPQQTRRVFERARARGLPVKLHAEQLSDQDGAALAAGFGALSCDHLEYLSERGARAMAAAGTVAVLLPAAYYFLRETRLPPLELLRSLGMPLALATDCNPGSAPCLSPLLVMNMACTLFRMTPAEALAGFTRAAARALGLADRGRLAPGLRADLAVWQVDRPAELAYWIGRPSPLALRIVGGRLQPAAGA